MIKGLNHSRNLLRVLYFNNFEAQIAEQDEISLHPPIFYLVDVRPNTILL